MEGKLDFKQSLIGRVSLLKGLEAESTWRHVKEKLEFTNGARELCQNLKKEYGCKLAVVSGGFMPVAMFVKEELGLDYAFANEVKLFVLGSSTKVL